MEMFTVQCMAGCNGHACTINREGRNMNENASRQVGRSEFVRASSTIALKIQAGRWSSAYRTVGLLLIGTALSGCGSNTVREIAIDRSKLPALCPSSGSYATGTAVVRLSVNVAGDVVAEPPCCQVDKEAVIVWVPDKSIPTATIRWTDLCTSTIPGTTPDIEGKFERTFDPIQDSGAAPLSIQIGYASAKEYRYCIQSGTHITPNPAIIIKPDSACREQAAASEAGVSARSTAQ